MNDKERDLKYIDMVIEALRDAQYHIKQDKWYKTDTDTKYAYRYIKKVCPHASSEERNYNCSCCYCRCYHHHRSRHLAARKFFAKVSDGIRVGDELIIPAPRFVDDLGHNVAYFQSTYEYMTLYVNGMIQQNGIFTVTPSAALITGGAQLNSDDPITVELVLQK